MIQRALSLQPVRVMIILVKENKLIRGQAIVGYLDLNPGMMKTRLREEDWAALKVYSYILMVIFFFMHK